MAAVAVSSSRIKEDTGSVYSSEKATAAVCKVAASAEIAAEAEAEAVAITITKRVEVIQENLNDNKYELIMKVIEID
jgi:hypothetical protein